MQVETMTTSERCGLPASSESAFGRSLSGIATEASKSSSTSRSCKPTATTDISTSSQPQRATSRLRGYWYARKRPIRASTGIANRPRSGANGSREPDGENSLGSAGLCETLREVAVYVFFSKTVGLAYPYRWKLG